MSDTSTAAQQEINRFASLAAMSASHRDLLKRHREQGDTPEITGSVEQFILRGRATGALLDDEDDRWVAQGLLDYWATKVYRTGYEPPDGTLDEFDPGLAPELPDDLRPYVGLDAFRENENDVFFGRQALVGAALEILKSHRLLVLSARRAAANRRWLSGPCFPNLNQARFPAARDGATSSASHPARARFVNWPGWFGRRARATGGSMSSRRPSCIRRATSPC